MADENRLPEPYATIIQIVRQIPSGKVATYGQIADMAGLINGPRRVGFALKINDDDSLPWHRVVNAAGRISERGDGESESVQYQRLIDEGIAIIGGRINMQRHIWDGEYANPAQEPQSDE